MWLFCCRGPLDFYLEFALNFFSSLSVCSVFLVSCIVVYFVGHCFVLLHRVLYLVLYRVLLYLHVVLYYSPVLILSYLPVANSTVPIVVLSCFCNTNTVFSIIVVVVVVDSHIQRIVLATEETTVTQQVSHRPIKRQSRLWSQRGTKFNGSHHGDNPLLRPTGIQIATKSYAALQAMAPTNIKTVHQTSLLHSRATSIDSECCRLPTTSVLSKKPEKLRSNQF